MRRLVSRYNDRTSRIEEELEELLHRIKLFHGEGRDVADDRSSTGSGLDQSYGRAYFCFIGFKHDDELTDGQANPGVPVFAHLARAHKLGVAAVPRLEAFSSRHGRRFQ